MPGDRVAFLTLDEVLAIHARLIEAFGGAEGVRDLGLLESVLYRPQTGYYEDLVQMAAALFESLLMNHPFVDGNKRVAFFATDVFLRMNGWRIEVDPDQAHAFLTHPPDVLTLREAVTDVGLFFFFTTRCPYCQQSWPNVTQLASDLEGPAVSVVGVALDGQEARKGLVLSARSSESSLP